MCAAVYRVVFGKMFDFSAVSQRCCRPLRLGSHDLTSHEYMEVQQAGKLTCLQARVVVAHLTSVIFSDLP